MAMLTHLANVLAFYAVGRAIFPSVPALGEHLLIVPLVLFSTAIPLPFGALGVSEQVSAGLFRLADSADGALAMMGFRVLQYAVALMASVFYFTHRDGIRRLAEATETDGDRIVEAATAAAPAIVRGDAA